MRGSYQPFSSWKSARNMWSVKLWRKPSSPSLGCFLGFAVLLTRIGSMAIALSPLEDDRLAVQPEDLAVHLGDLAQRDVVLHRVQQYRHPVDALATGLRPLLEPSLHPGGVPRCLDLHRPLPLLALDGVVDLEV